MKKNEKTRRQYWLCVIIVQLLILSFGITLNGMAQERNITGIVNDENGTPLPGVTLLLKGTSKGTVTDLNGAFSIKITDDNAVLVVTYLGYTAQEIKVGTQSAFTIALKEEISTMDEVVVIGYGTQKKKLTTGANVHVGAEEIEQMHSLRLEQALQGLTPGVQITANSGQPGEAMKVRIRGVGTVGNSDPIYIVDGIPVQDISFINNADIESTDILKDAASAAIYGTRAANGVVLITTKKGKTGSMHISVDSYYGIQNTPKEIDMLNGQQYATILNEMASYIPNSKTPFSPAFIDSIGTGTNWMGHLFTKNAPTRSIVVSTNGGSETASYLSSISYYNQDGIIGSADKSNFERVTVKVRTDQKTVNDFFKTGENITYNHSKKKGVGVGDKYNNIVRGFANTTPIFPLYDASMPDSIDKYGMSYYADESNPVGDMHYKNMSENITNQLVGDAYAELEPIKGLKIKSDYGIDFSYRNYNAYSPVFFLSQLNKNVVNNATQSIDMNYSTNFENTATYSVNIGNNSITALLGNTVWDYNRYYVYGNKEGLVFDDYDHALLDNGTIEITQKTSGTKLKRAMLSYFGRLNYSYKEKYLFALTLRRDGSSKFGPANKWGNFPSVSAGWILSQEEMFKYSWLDFFKLRGSWGQNGNDQIPDFLYEATVSSRLRDYYFGTNETKKFGTSPDKISNPNLKWEQSEQLDFGFDARFLKDFSLAFDLYDKKTIGLLVNVPVPDIAGAGSAVYKNAGDVSNKGLEAALSYQKIMGDFSFKVSANISFNKNEMLKINNSEGIIHGDKDVLFHGSQEFYRAQEGYPIGYFYGFKTNGIFQTKAEIDANIAKDANGTTILDKNDKPLLVQPLAVPGDVIFQDLNKNGKIDDDDRTMIGDPNPDYTYGFSLNCDYKGFDLSVVTQGVAGNQIAYNLRDNERDWKNYSTTILDRWHGEGTSNRMPRVAKVSNDKNQNYMHISDLYMYDGDFFKVRSVNIGYNFAKSLFNNKVSQFRLYVSAQNVLTFTKYPGYDPEVGYGTFDSKRYENFSTGIDIGYYPVPVSYMAGVQVTF